MYVVSLDAGTNRGAVATHSPVTTAKPLLLLEEGLLNGKMEGGGGGVIHGVCATMRVNVLKKRSF